jgi:glycosyltransferase involved in cell wall biosynthesis
MPGTKLLMVGDGPQLDEIKAKAESLGIEDSVIFIGEMNHEAFLNSSIFRACDLFVTSSITETQGIAALEAQANGLPCVGINRGGINDLVKDGYNGYMVKLGDKKGFADRVIKILSDSSLIEKMKKNAIATAKKQDISIITAIWEKEYSKLIKNYEK